MRLAVCSLLALLACDSLTEFRRDHRLDLDNPHFIPPPVDSLAASSVGLYVHLSWTDASIWEEGFIVERSADSLEPYVEIARLQPDRHSYADLVSVRAFRLHYRVTPYFFKDGAEVRGEARHASVPVTPFPTTAPTITLTSETALTLRWIDPYWFETGYVIERRIGAGPFAPLDTVPASTTSIVDTFGPEGIISYAYRVVPVRDSVSGPTSRVATVTQTVSPPAQLNLTAEPSGLALRMSWSAVPLASGYRVWRSSSSGRQLLATLPPNVLEFIDEHPDTLEAVHGYSVATLTSIPTAERTAQFRAAMVAHRILSDGGAPMTCVAFGPGGVIVAGDEARRLTVWSEDGTLLRRIDLSGIPVSIDVHPGQPWVLATVSDAFGHAQSVEIYDHGTGALVTPLSPAGYFGAFSPSGDRMAVPGAPSTVVVRNTTDFATVAVLNVPLPWAIYVARFSPDGSKVLVGLRGGYAYLFDAATGTRLRTFTCVPADIVSVSFTPDGSACFVPGGYLRGGFIFDVATGARLWYEWTTVQWMGAFLSNTTLITSGWGDRQATIWDVTSRSAVVTAPGHQGMIRWIAVSPAGMPATASNDGTVRIWKLGRQWLVD